MGIEWAHSRCSGISTLIYASVVMTITPASAQWIGDRFNNSIVNADKIAARYQEQIRAQLQHYRSRATQLPPPMPAEAEAMRDQGAWWLSAVSNPLGGATGKPLKISLPYAYDSAILNSAQIRAYGDVPAIRDTAVAEVQGRYALRAYAEARADDINDPTRSLAVTQGSTRLLTNNRALEGGLRQLTLTGAEVSVGQRFATINTNSTDFIPGRQTISRTFVTVVQPLLRNSGIEYSRSLHEVARLDALLGRSEFRRQLEGHLLEVARAYWTLWLARSSYLQRARVAEAAGAIVSQLSNRSGLDADVLLLSRARSAQSQREAELLRARATVSNAEVRLRALMNDPRLDQSIGEVIPVGAPLAQYENLPLRTVLGRAVAFRPEVQQVALQHRSAILREGQAQIEALPRLDAIAEANIGGRGLSTGQIGRAIDDSIDNAGQPGWVLGMRLEIPLQPDDAAARLSRRRLETRLSENQGYVTINTVFSEAELALNEYEVAWREVGARSLALRATRSDRDLEHERWKQGIGGAMGENAINGLERLLSAQDRVADAEERLALAQSTFTVSFLTLQRIQGTFTAVQKIGIERIDDAARGPAYVARRQSQPTINK